jgi:hypothetical protein
MVAKVREKEENKRNKKKRNRSLGSDYGVWCGARGVETRYKHETERESKRSKA